MKNYYVHSIVWDTDNAGVELPTEVLIKAEEQNIADALSDQFGYCVSSFEYESLSVRTLRNLVKAGRLFYDFRVDREEEKEEEIAAGGEWKDEYSFIEVEEITDKYAHDWINRELQGKQYEGVYVINAPDVDPTVFKRSDISIIDCYTLSINDRAWHRGEKIPFTITNQL